MALRLEFWVPSEVTPAEEGHLRMRTANVCQRSSQILLLFTFQYLSFIIRFYFIYIPYFLFCVYSPHISSPCCLVAWNPLGTTTPASPCFSLPTHKGSEKNSYSVSLSSFLFVSLCFPFISVLSLVTSKRIFTPWDFTNSVFAFILFCSSDL